MNKKAIQALHKKHKTLGSKHSKALKEVGKLRTMLVSDKKNKEVKAAFNDSKKKAQELYNSMGKLMKQLFK